MPIALTGLAAHCLRGVPLRLSPQHPQVCRLLRGDLHPRSHLHGPGREPCPRARLWTISDRLWLKRPRAARRAARPRRAAPRHVQQPPWAAAPLPTAPCDRRCHDDDSHNASALCSPLQPLPPLTAGGMSRPFSSRVVVSLSIWLLPLSTGGAVQPGLCDLVPQRAPPPHHLDYAREQVL